MPTTKAKKSAAKKPAKKAAVKKVAKKPAKKAVKKAAKKAPAKKTTKKAPAKKRASRAKAKRELVYAPDQHSFWVSDGQVLNSLLALRDALAEMEKEVYLYHATGDNNDFAMWVDHVLCDADCAAALTKAKTPNSAKTVVVRHLKLYAV